MVEVRFNVGSMLVQGKNITLNRINPLYIKGLRLSVQAVQCKSNLLSNLLNYIFYINYLIYTLKNK